MWRSFAVLGALGGCYKPTPPAGAPCNQASECPSPLMCIAGTCTTTGDAMMMIDAPADTPVMPDAFHMLVPSNGITPMFPPGNTSVLISGNANFNVDTGRVSGSIARPSGAGIIGGIGYEQTDYMGAPLAVFTFHDLSVTQTGNIQLSGSRAVVFVVEKDMMMAGMIDGAGGCGGGSRPCAGPGGGTGGTYTTAATGCGIGLHGSHDLPTGADTGGGGGGGGTDGAAGGVETASSTMFPGGMPGTACIPATLEPLVGGSGGGGGGNGKVTPESHGGGGGGAFQLTCMGNLTITGTISMGGAGGDGGTPDPDTVNPPNGGAGGGGGGGGGILVEGVGVTISGTLAANGGAGGGGSAQANAGTPGQNAIVGATPAAGGAGGGNAGKGGDGGTGMVAPAVGAASTDVNAGAGGGGAGVIVIRALTPNVTGTVSPPPMILAPHSQ